MGALMTQSLPFSPVGSPTLWPHQQRALEGLSEAIQGGAQSPLLVLPTGSGKTVIAAEIIRREVRAGGSALFLAPRRELVAQTSQKLDAVGVNHGILLAGTRERLGEQVQVASIDTLVSRLLVRGTLRLPPFRIVFMDEAHLSITLIRQKLLTLLSTWDETIRIGLTATPTRKDGRALGTLFDALVEPATTQQLTDAGFLVPARYWSWPPPDLTGVKTTAGD